MTAETESTTAQQKISRVGRREHENRNIRRLLPASTPATAHYLLSLALKVASHAATRPARPLAPLLVLLRPLLCLLGAHGTAASRGHPLQPQRQQGRGTVRLEVGEAGGDQRPGRCIATRRPWLPRRHAPHLHRVPSRWWPLPAQPAASPPLQRVTQHMGHAQGGVAAEFGRMHAYGGAVGGGRGQRAGWRPPQCQRPSTACQHRQHSLIFPFLRCSAPLPPGRSAAARGGGSGGPRRLLGWLSAPGCLRQPEQRLSSSLRSLGLLLPHRSLVCSIFCCHAHGGGAGKPRPGWAAELDGLLLPSSASCARSAASSSPSAVPSESMSASLAREGGPGARPAGAQQPAPPQRAAAPRPPLPPPRTRRGLPAPPRGPVPALAVRGCPTRASAAAPACCPLPIHLRAAAMRVLARLGAMPPLAPQAGSRQRCRGRPASRTWAVGVLER